MVQHVYVPHPEIVEAYPVEFFGFDVTSVAQDRRPSDQARAVTARLIDRYFESSDVDFLVVNDGLGRRPTVQGSEYASMRLAFILGPTELHLSLDQPNGTHQWLEDKGKFPSLLYLTD
jgi:hypothetical protein